MVVVVPVVLRAIVEVRVVTIVVVVRVVTVVVVAAIVSSVPGGVSVVGSAVVVHTAAVPMAAPAIPPPATAASAHHCSYSNSCPERKEAGCNQVGSAVTGGAIGHTIDYGRVIRGNVDDLWVRRLDDDCLLSALSFRLYGLLRCTLQIAGSLRLLSKRLIAAITSDC
jgi:hypothetical protein